MKENLVAIRVSRSGGKSGAASVNLALVPVTAQPDDYTPLNPSTLTWSDGDASTKTVTVQMLPNAGYEPADEEFRIELSNATGAALGAAKRSVFIHDPSIAPTPTLSFDRPQVLKYGEGSNGVVRISWTRSGIVPPGASVDWSLTPGTAVAGRDYVQDNRTIVFNSAGRASVASSKSCR